MEPVLAFAAVRSQTAHHILLVPWGDRGINPVRTLVLCRESAPVPAVRHLIDSRPAAVQKKIPANILTGIFFRNTFFRPLPGILALFCVTLSFQKCENSS